MNQPPKMKIIGLTQPHYQKKKNGDTFHHEFISEENIFLALVADGVGGQPCDWKASDLGCEIFTQSFKSLTNLPPKERIVNAIHQANTRIRNERGNCYQMHTTLCLFASFINEQKFIICNIGDSRIYQLSQLGINCLTQDDSISHKTTVQQAFGKREIYRTKLTEYLGKHHLKIKTKEIGFSKEMRILLCTDGYYTARISSYDNDLKAIAKSVNPEETFTTIFNKYRSSAKDDMTAILIHQ